MTDTTKKDKVFVASVYPNKDKFEKTYFKMGFTDDDMAKMADNRNEKGYANVYLQQSKEGKWYAHVLPPQEQTAAGAVAPSDFDI